MALLFGDFGGLEDCFAIDLLKILLDFILRNSQIGIYTEMDSKIENLARRCPGFEPGLPLSKQHKFNNLCDADRLKVRGLTTQPKANF